MGLGGKRGFAGVMWPVSQLVAGAKWIFSGSSAASGQREGLARLRGVVVGPSTLESTVAEHSKIKKHLVSRARGLGPSIGEGDKELSCVARQDIKERPDNAS